MLETFVAAITRPFVFALVACGGLYIGSGQAQADNGQVNANHADRTSRPWPSLTASGKRKIVGGVTAVQTASGFAPEAAPMILDTVGDGAAVTFAASTSYGVIGSSGPMILSKLAAAGGPVFVGGTSGYGVAGLQDRYLYSNCDNERACEAASIGGYAGFVAGTATTVGLAASYGVGASGLATIGGLIGGGMAAGAVGLIALPAIGAIAVGAGVYGIAHWLMD